MHVCTSSSSVQRIQLGLPRNLRTATGTRTILGVGTYLFCCATLSRNHSRLVCHVRQVHDAFAQVLAEFGRIDVVVNNAGTFLTSTIADMVRSRLRSLPRCSCS